MKKLTISKQVLALSVISILFLPWNGRIADLAQKYNRNLHVLEACQVEKSIDFWTRERNINVYSFLAIITQESEFNPNAVGGGGERGLGQISRICLKELNGTYGTSFTFDRLFEIDYNIQVATLHYHYCVKLAKSQRKEAIARYRTPFAPEDSGYYAQRILKIRAKIKEELGPRK